MLDNLHVKLPLQQQEFRLIKNNNWEEVYHNRDKHLLYYEFRYRNVCCRFFKDDEELIIMGSWTKLAQGHNITIVSIDEILNALDILTNKLGVDIMDGKITRLEFGINLLLEKEVRLYNRCLLHHYYSKVRRRSMENDQTISFATKRYEYRFYDKLSEAKSNKYMKHMIDEDMMDKNIMRYEILIPKQMIYTFGRHLKVSDLVDPAFWEELLNKLSDTYFNDIIKSSSFNLDKKIKTPTDLKQLVMSIGDYYIKNNNINIDWESDDLTPQQKTAIRKTFRTIPTSKYNVKDPLVAELDSKVQDEINRVKSEVQSWKLYKFPDGDNGDASAA